MSAVQNADLFSAMTAEIVFFRRVFYGDEEKHPFLAQNSFLICFWIEFFKKIFFSLFSAVKNRPT